VINRTKMIGVAILAMFAISIVATAAAQAEEGPSITVESKNAGETKRLGAGETRNIVVKAFSSEFILKDETNVYEAKCKTLTAKPAVLLGAAAGTDPTSDEILEFSNCTGKEGTKICTIAEPIKTKPLKNELVESTTGGTLLVLFKPETGKIFAEYTETGCVGTIKVEGEELAQAYFDESGAKGAAVTLSSPKGLKKSWILETEVSPAAKVFKFSNGVRSEVAVKPFEVLGTPATLTGEALLELANGGNWSPLA